MDNRLPRATLRLLDGERCEEELAFTPEAVDMSCFDAGTVQVIDSHRVHGGVAAIPGMAIRGSYEME